MLHFSIAEKHFISKRTVENHRAHLLKKNRTQKFIITGAFCFQEQPGGPKIKTGSKN